MVDIVHGTQATAPHVSPTLNNEAKPRTPKFQKCPKCHRADIVNGPAQLLRHCGSRDDHYELMTDLKSIVDKKRSRRTTVSGQACEKRRNEPAATSEVTGDTTATTTVTTPLPLEEPLQDVEVVAPMATAMNDTVEVTRRLTAAFPGSHIVVCLLNK